MDLKKVKDLLPPVVIELTELIGYPATESLIKQLGGITFPVGKCLEDMSPLRAELLIAAVGKENALTLCKIYGGGLVYLPRCDAALRQLRNQSFLDELAALRDSGTSMLMALTGLCPRYGFSDRYAWKLLSRKALYQEQCNLFD